jgi:hypothetical protein
MLIILVYLCIHENIFHVFLINVYVYIKNVFNNSFIYHMIKY